MEAETIAILKALKYCQGNNYNNFVLEIDSLSITNIVRREWKIPWKQIQEIHAIISSTNAQIQHVFREVNKLVDKLANEACEHDNAIQIQAFQQLSVEGKGIVSLDKAEIPSLRIKTRKGIRRINRASNIHVMYIMFCHHKAYITVNKTNLPSPDYVSLHKMRSTKNDALQVGYGKVDLRPKMIAYVNQTVSICPLQLERKISYWRRERKSKIEVRECLHRFQTIALKTWHLRNRCGLHCIHWNNHCKGIIHQKVGFAKWKCTGQTLTSASCE
ncbi:hypothetical protein MTR67_038531 [Solanum verrucosum]|uniref:RNase H type-1 domain-containing protein n=1 Tax=Solanum verrucosum TaxID=315347 RepID=A0AAF0UGN5_SOLVR|nr:hypothetical protein MTR67_038531 [Solanum verrucosum]